ncbi:MAG: DinB family protein [Planctomycetota bacterium]
MFERETTILRFMQSYGDDLLADIEPEAMCRQPVTGINHPAWVLGHLAVAADHHSQYAGATPQLGEDWNQRFGFASVLTDNPDDYPSKDDLIEAWHTANERLIAAAASADKALLDEPTRGPLVSALPTCRDFLAFSMTGHTSMHLGQLSAWRRADGRKPLF